MTSASVVHRCSQRMVQCTVLVKDLLWPRCIRNGTILSAVIKEGGSHTFGTVRL